MKRIFLTGYMGAGKTTVGRKLSKQLDLYFIDLDYYIEGRFHKEIRQLFAERGEDVFRDIERRMLHEVASFEDVLVSTGGGTPCFFDNIDFMNAEGTTVYLKVTAGELARRLESCKQSRPVLESRRGEDLRRYVAESLEARRPYYEKAQIILDAERMTTLQDVQEITSRLLGLLGSPSDMKNTADGAVV